MCFTGLAIVQNGVAMAEGSTFAVLSRYANSGAAFEKTRKGKCFRCTPVELFIALRHFTTGIQPTYNLGVWRKTSRHLSLSKQEVFELL